MNKVKRLGILDRIRAARRAFMGLHSGHLLTYGLEVKRCSDCERGDCESCGYKIHSEAVSNLPNCNSCSSVQTCPYLPKIGSYSRINCPLYVGSEGEEIEK